MDNLSSNSCIYLTQPFLKQRFYLVGVFGTAVAMVSVCENALLFVTLVSRHVQRNSYALYLIFLAMLDILVSAAYMLLMSVNVHMEYFQSFLLFRAWFAYIVPLLTLTHCLMTASSFLILAAAFEQFLSVLKLRLRRPAARFRLHICVGTMLLGILCKGSMLFEIQVDNNAVCTGTLAQFTLGFSALATQAEYNLYWRFWFRNIVTVFLPFFLLSYFNIRVVAALKKERNAFGNSMQNAQLSVLQTLLPHYNRKRSALESQVRSATRMLILVACTYLISNVLNVLVTAWEIIDQSSLFTTFLNFYSFSADLVSLLTVVACAFRLPIYCLCKHEIRQDFTTTLRLERLTRRSKEITNGIILRRKPQFE